MKRIGQPWSFRAKFLLSTVLISLILPTMGGLFLYNREANTAKSLIFDEVVHQTTSLAKSLPPAIAFEDVVSAYDLIDSLSINPQIKRVSVWKKNLESKFADFEYFTSVHPDDSSEYPSSPPQIGEIWAERTLRVTKPILSFDEQVGLISVERSLSDLIQKRTTFIQFVGSSWFIIILIILMVTLWYQNALTRPLKELMTVAEKISTEGTYGHRAKKLSEDEFGKLTTLFNQMMDSLAESNRRLLESKNDMEDRVKERTLDLTIANQRIIAEMNQKEKATSELIQTKDQLNKREKLASVGQVSSNIAHELRNPMAAIRNSVYFLRLKNEDDPKVTHHLEVIDRELSRSDEVIERLLQMTKEESIKIESVDLEELAKEALMYTDTSNSSDFRFRYEPDAFEVKVDRILFRQVLSNLFLNSIQASNGSPGRCPLGVIAQKKGGPSVQIRVWDRGSGITSEHRERIFEPLYSDKMDGVGLGLPLCKDILVRHKGKISLEKTSSEGTVFLIELPN